MIGIWRLKRRMLGTALCAALLCSCATSPTGRSQLSLVSDSQMRQMGISAFNDMKQKIPISTDTRKTAYVRCVADAITARIDSNEKWEVTLFDDEQVNAFALPGGKIGIYTGLLKVAENQDQLAAVMGHEVAHVLADHGKARLSASMAAQAGMILGSTVIGSSSSSKKDRWMSALGLGMQFGVIMPYGRAQESESDILGLDMMASAGFDPRASTQLWRNMAAQEKTSMPQILSTHPAPGTRIRDLEKRIPAALKLQAGVARPRCG